MFGIVMPWTRIKALENTIKILEKTIAGTESECQTAVKLADAKQTELDRLTQRWNDAQEAIRIGKARLATREKEKAKERAKTAARRAAK